MLYSEFNYLTDKNSFTYTIDMVRFRKDVFIDDFKKFNYILCNSFKDYIKKSYLSYRISDFRHNYVIEYSEDVSFWIGCLHNSQIVGLDCYNDLNFYNFTFEFNPNKVPLDYVIKLIFDVFGYDGWFVKSADFTIDVPINILDICGLDKSKYKDLRIFNAGFDNLTYYLGKSNNRVKIYNKKIEAQLDYNLTRFELSHQLDLVVDDDFDKFVLDVKFPDVYKNSFTHQFDDLSDRTLLTILYAVQNGYPLNNLTRKYKLKVKELLSSGYKIDFDISIMDKVFHNCIKFILNFK